MKISFDHPLTRPLGTPPKSTENPGPTPQTLSNDTRKFLESIYHNRHTLPLKDGFDREVQINIDREDGKKLTYWFVLQGSLIRTLFVTWMEGFFQKSVRSENRLVVDTIIDSILRDTNALRITSIKTL